MPEGGGTWAAFAGAEAAPLPFLASCSRSAASIVSVWASRARGWTANDPWSRPVYCTRPA